MDTWKRNLYVVWVAEFIAIAGFYVTFPFMPYYVQQLGVKDLKQVELWSGAIAAAQAVTMAIFAPIWGSLADRFGRKMMIERATLGSAVVLATMGFAHNVQQVVLLRALQGALTGTVAAATSLVASTTPREHAGQALGALQMAIWLGGCVGPLIGGVVADTFGYRAVFWVTGGLLFTSGVIFWLFAREGTRAPSARTRVREEGFLAGFKLVFATTGLLALFAVRITVQLGTSVLTPIFPLFIQSLVPSTMQVATITGLISGITAAASAASALLLGRICDRRGFRVVMLACLGLAVVCWLPEAFVSSVWQLMILQAGVGFCLGGLLAAVSTAMANLAPEGRHGVVYGLDDASVSSASAVGPMLGASIAANWNLRVPFALTASFLGVAAALAWTLVPRHRPKLSPARQE